MMSSSQLRLSRSVGGLGSTARASAEGLWRRNAARSDRSHLRFDFRIGPRAAAVSSFSESDLTVAMGQQETPTPQKTPGRPFGFRQKLPYHPFRITADYMKVDLQLRYIAGGLS
jgi:hypothetical protein